MKIRRTKPTMKQQLFLFFMLAAVLVCLIFSAYYFVSEQRVLRNNLERENTKNLQYAIEKIEENAMRVEEFANQICQNGQIRALMLADDPFAPAETMAVGVYARRAVSVRNGYGGYSVALSDRRKRSGYPMRQGGGAGRSGCGVPCFLQ